MKKIIISSIIIGLILIVGISAIVLSAIPTGYNYTIAKPNEITIVYSKTKDLSPEALIYRDRNSKDAEIINNFYLKFCHAFEQKTLSAIFNGEINEGIKENYIDKGSKSISNNSSQEDKITICFKYSQSQKILNYSYTCLCFEISNTDARKENVFGVGSSFSVSNSYFYYNYYYSGKANFTSLFNYIESLA